MQDKGRRRGDFHYVQARGSNFHFLFKKRVTLLINKAHRIFFEEERVCYLWRNKDLFSFTQENVAPVLSYPKGAILDLGSGAQKQNSEVSSWKANLQCYLKNIERKASHIYLTGLPGLVCSGRMHPWRNKRDKDIAASAWCDFFCLIHGSVIPVKGPRAKSHKAYPGVPKEPCLWAQGGLFLMLVPN